MSPIERSHVSVVLPYYNRVDVLPDAIRSVLNQTHEDLTLFAVDDGSTDGSREAAEAFNDPRLVHASTRGRQGACAARNVGLSMAQSDLVAFQDSDDIWLPTKLETQIAELHAVQAYDPDVGVIGCGWRYIGQTTSEGSFPPGPHHRSDVLAGRVRGLRTPMLVVDRDRVGADVRFDEEMPARQDQDFVLTCLRSGCSVVIFPGVLAEVRRGRADHVARPANAARAYGRMLTKYAADLAEDPALESWMHFRAAREFSLVKQPRLMMKHWAAARREQALRRAVHLACGLVAGDKGLAVASKLLPVWDPRTPHGHPVSHG